MEQFGEMFAKTFVIVMLINHSSCEQADTDVPSQICLVTYFAVPPSVAVNQLYLAGLRVMMENN